MSNCPAETKDNKARSSELAPMAYSVGNTLQLLGISRSHLYSLALRGQVRLIKIGGKTLIAASEIERLLSGSTSHD